MDKDVGNRQIRVAAMITIDTGGTAVDPDDLVATVERVMTDSVLRVQTDDRSATAWVTVEASAAMLMNEALLGLRLGEAQRLLAHAAAALDPQALDDDLRRLTEVVAAHTPDDPIERPGP